MLFTYLALTALLLAADVPGDAAKPAGNEDQTEKKSINFNLKISTKGMNVPGNYQEGTSKPIYWRDILAPYQVMGAPPAPKVPMQWNRYHDHREMTEFLQKLAEAYPLQCKLTSLGKSYRGLDIWVLTITSDIRKADERTAMLIDGGIHANEIQATEVVLYTAWYLLEMQRQNPFIADLLRERTFYLIPAQSPDSRWHHMHLRNSTHSPRTGLRPRDDDNDGLFDEDAPNDFDRNGSITQMRVRDPNGGWKSHPEYPEVMVRVKPGEKGEFRLLGEEGIDIDGDGKINEDGPGYYDPNRNFPWQWQPDYVQRGADRYPLSIPEQRLVADFVMAHPKIAGAQSYHNTGGMILRGPGIKELKHDPRDLAVYNTLGKYGEGILPGYKYMEVATDLYEMRGGEHDWLFDMRGIFAFVNELFTPFNLFRDPNTKGFFSDSADLARFNKRLLFDQGFVPWKAWRHPFYGEVEIGGWRKEWTRQPPSFLLEEECHRNMAFTLYHAYQMPKIEIQKLEADKLRDDVWMVTATIANTRLIPTHAAVDIKRKLTPPDIAELRTSNGKVLAGMWSDEPFFEEPQKNKGKPERVRLPNIPGENARYVRWIVHGKPPFTVEVRSIKGGNATETFEASQHVDKRSPLLKSIFEWAKTRGVDE